MSKVITDEARAFLDKDGPPFTIEVDGSELVKFATAARWPQPPNPLFSDERYARRTRWGGMIAAPTYCTSFKWAGDLMAQVNPTMGKYRVGLNGGNEYEFFEPIRVGDVLTGKPRLSSLEEKPRDDGGVLLVLSMSADVFNQLGDKVLTMRQTLLRIYGPDQVRTEATA